jgi:hypothetical protein
MAPRELPVTFDCVVSKNLEQLKLLNSVIFPIKYAVRPLPLVRSSPQAQTAASLPLSRSYGISDALQLTLQDEIYKQCMACGDLTQLGRPSGARRPLVRLAAFLAQQSTQDPLPFACAAFHNDVLVGAIAVRCERQVRAGD